MRSAISERGSRAFNGVPEGIGVDAAALASELTFRTGGEVLFDPGYRAIYAILGTNRIPPGSFSQPNRATVLSCLDDYGFLLIAPYARRPVR